MSDLTHLQTEAARALETALSAGANDARVRLRETRRYQLRVKNDDVELLQQSQQRGLGLTLYVDGRFGAFGTSDLRPAAVADFTQRAVDMVRLTDPDPARGLPDPETTRPLPKVALDTVDPALVASQKERGQALCERLVAAMRGVDTAVFHAESGFVEEHGREALLTSQGFVGTEEHTYLALSASCYVKDRDERKQVGWNSRYWCHLADMDEPEELGQEAARRALARRGTAPAPTGEYPIIFVNYWGDYVTGLLLQAISGASIYRKMSCLDGKLDTLIASPVLSLTDDPFVPRSLSSRTFDGEGMVAERRPVIDKGVLRTYYFDSYWARKQGVKATSGDTANLVFAPGTRSGEAMVAALPRGIFITDIIGGNFNATTGDFSTGIAGFLIEEGKLARPVSEMNLAGNLLDLLPKLEEVGNDPYPYMSIRSPALRFAPLRVTGT